MSEPINQISQIEGCGHYQSFQSRLYTHFGSGEGKGTKQTSSKFILDDNTIVYEKYDHHGKLISRIPWSPSPIGEKA